MDDETAFEFISRPLEKLAMSYYKDKSSFTKKHQLILSYIESLENNSLANNFIAEILFKNMSADLKPEIKKKRAGNPNKITIDPIKIDYYVLKTSKNMASKLLGVDRKSVSNLMTNSTAMITDERVKAFMDKLYLNEFENDLSAYKDRVGSNK
ncbi:hypothetical protein [Pseudocolwellia sp. HL-MZ7]|uniref:hypothetical protein n=1 Tax=Pseudocolwellia sp. HL-MZ7 TaxID=3400627 RepID=UPI003CEC2D5B